MLFFDSNSLLRLMVMKSKFTCCLVRSKMGPAAAEATDEDREEAHAFYYHNQFPGYGK